MADINWPQAQRILDEVSNGGLITFPAGIPLREEGGEIVGGIGVSGSSVENDHMVAEADAKALG